jgi:hypothetical protein
MNVKPASEFEQAERELTEINALIESSRGCNGSTLTPQKLSACYSICSNYGSCVSKTVGPPRL